MLVHHSMSQLAASSSKGGSGFGSIILFLIVLGALYFFMLRPARARQKKALAQRAQIEIGVEVVTTAGLIAYVVDLDDETVTLEIAPGVHSKFLRQAIARVVEPPVEEDPADAGEHEAIDPEPTQTGEADGPTGEHEAIEPEHNDRTS